jgi:hypothetical protein
MDQAKISYPIPLSNLISTFARYRYITTDATPTPMIALNYVIFYDYYRCQHICVVCSVSVSVLHRLL